MDVVQNLINIVKGLCGNDRWLPAGTETLCMMLNISGPKLFQTLNIVLSKFKPPGAFLEKRATVKIFLCTNTGNIRIC